MNKELRFLSHAFKLAVDEWEWLEKNPLDKVSRETEELRPERWLTFEEEQIIIPHCAPWIQITYYFRYRDANPEI